MSIFGWSIGVVEILIFAAIVLLYLFRNRVTSLSLSRTCFELYLNDISELGKAEYDIEQIDFQVRRSIRKGTMRLMLLDPDEYDDELLVRAINADARLPLMFAAYENHHTREISPDGGGEAYIADKTYDVWTSLHVWQKIFPDITESHVEKLVKRWLKTVVIPQQNRACQEKLCLYKEWVTRKAISKAVKDIFNQCAKKNDRYVERLTALGKELSFEIDEPDMPISHSGCTIVRRTSD